MGVTKSKHHRKKVQQRITNMVKLFFKILLVIFFGSHVLGVFGGLSENHLDTSMQSCSMDEECTIDNEKCHHETFCGTKECQSKSDCIDIGNLLEGKYIPESCKNGIFKYARPM